MSSFHQYKENPPQGIPTQVNPNLNNYNAGYSNMPASQNPQDFFKFQNVSPEMINLGISAGQDIISRQKDKWMPGLSSLWLSLKYYFAVSFFIAT